ncbi:amidase signature domain-containing protein [Clohesyomyces aquaticus]|uniref:Amidase signature domain-containing protein n=1 Tax=Clohesyomyces aquaticus TaxID=1231657 RepID=A0A1Y1YJP8_9PLEO|nr:amidase signature domain-containing protein [Clohesyomyces aquaticus]
MPIPFTMCGTSLIWRILTPHQQWLPADGQAAPFKIEHQDTSPFALPILGIFKQTPGLANVIQQNGITFTIRDRLYFARVASELEELKLPRRLSGPTTLILLGDGKVTNDSLVEKTRQFQADDDVFTSDFLQNIVFVENEPVGKARPTFKKNAQKALNEWGSQIARVRTRIKAITSGPFYIHEGALFRVWRLFADPQDAYFLATIPSAANIMKYQPFHISDGHRPYIAVPSRLYFPRTPQKPLNGLRVSVKDNIDLAGVQTALSCRAWGQVYEAKRSSARSLEKLLELGAVVVAKSTLSQFAETEYPTADWVDYHCPFNPRGDGYLTPEGSSSGAAAALAAYDYLDASIATDTGGSIREPAARQGLFGIRTTFASVSLDGVFPLSNALDTLGFMTRDVKVLADVANAWLNQGKEPKIYAPTKIICFSTFEYETGPSRDVFNSFASALESHTGISRTVIDLFSLWNETDSLEEGQSMTEFIGKTMAALKNPDLWRHTQDFRDQYQERFGKPPYVNPSIRLKWEAGRNTTPEMQEQAIKRQDRFRAWFETHILEVSSNKENQPLIVFPLSDEEAEYRDDYADGPWIGGSGFHRNFISSLTGCPEIIIPIGQIPYKSRVSQRQEHMPAVASFLGPRNQDAAIANFAKEFLEKMHLPTKVRTGTVAFEGIKCRL